MKETGKGWEQRQIGGGQSGEKQALCCEWCGGQIIKAAGCWRCTNCGWQGCGG